MTKPRTLLWMLSAGLMAFSSVAGAESGAEDLGAVAGERIDPGTYSAGVVESMDVVQARDEQRAGGVDENPKARNGAPGQWVVPSRRASFYPHSGNHYAMNKWGDTRMGIQFPTRVDVDGAYFAGQGNHGAWAPAVRAHGYRDGTLVRTTPWLIGLEETPQWLAMDLRDVDRIVIEAQAAVEGAGWYGLDDLRYTLRAAADGKATATVVDFESADYGRTLTESGYANLVWELGSGDFTAVEAIHPPQVPVDQIPPPPADEEPASGTRGGLGTLPDLESSFQTVIQGGGPGTGSIPPDTCGAIGPNHFVTAVNSNLSAYNKSAPHTRVMNVSLNSFLPGSSGDPRVLYDQHSGRWIVLATDFNTRIYFSV